MLGALLLCPPDLIERQIPMIAPLASTLEVIRNRREVDKLLEECWKNSDAGYEIQPTDEWIVNNQEQLLLQEGDRFGILEQDTTATPTDENSIAKRKQPSTYGEITSKGARQLFGAMGLLDDSPRNNNNNNKSQQLPIHFFDLGSGAGKLVGQVVLELPNDRVERATGIELSPSRHESAIVAREALRRLRSRRLDWSTSRNNNNDSISFVSNHDKLELLERDLFDVDLSTATHIYVASLCFPHNLMVRLEERLQQLMGHHHHREEEQEEFRNDAEQDGSPENRKLQWVASLQPFPNNLGGIRPVVRFMEMSWTKPLGCAVYLYRCNDKH